MTFFVPLAYPTAFRGVSDSFQDHVNRGSVNPGTDYTAPYGSDVVSVADGYVADIVVTNYGSGGRMIYVDHDDGSGVDYLHLSRIDVRKGDRVMRRQHLGLSGASGFRDDWYYGPHLHISIRNRHGSHAMNAGNYDFDASIKRQWQSANWASDGGSTPINNDPPIIIPPEEANMNVIRADNGSIALVGESYFGEFSGSDTAGVEAAVAAFGPVKPVTGAQYATAKERALGRRAALLTDIRAAVKS